LICNIIRQTTLPDNHTVAAAELAKHNGSSS